MIRVCLAFPDLREIGANHLGQRVLYKVLKEHPGVEIDRCYALPSTAAPLTESGRSLSEFDVVGFSLQSELTYTNVLAMVGAGGIPLRSEQRDAHPLIVGGGPTATHAEPLAPFCDVILIGDGEEAFPRLVRAWRDAKGSRRERLRALASLRGVYAPSLYECELVSGFQVARGPRVERALVHDLDAFPFPDDVAPSDGLFHRSSIEIARGCTEGCRFCQAGMIYRPVRERSPESVARTAMSMIAKSGVREVAITSLSTADHSCIGALVRSLAPLVAAQGARLHVSALRAHAVDGELVAEMLERGVGGLTLAPEAASQRLRDVINRDVTEEDLFAAAGRMVRGGTRSIHLHFMIGLPTETEEDVRAIARLGSRLRSLGAEPEISVAAHVPKPHTPFQWMAFDPDDIERRAGWLREEADALGVDVRIWSGRSAWVEAALARGDRRLAQVIEQAYRLGCRFDVWPNQRRVELWERAFEVCGLPASRYLAARSVGEPTPWDYADVGLVDGFLEREYRRAMLGAPSPPCGKPLPGHARPVCYDCGVGCDLRAMQVGRAERLVAARSLLRRRERAAP
ncbi:B12-binding domain/radical SAM domain-containing protein [Sorangium cellulosum]|uniref:B12-binding domain/radical SAM domain-containing protein n=1 Tax=Sorangium cellulosum TaxID=56 RepID=A0A4P2QB50_SORCE|nr:radical SAM protein [Sorangium cellulosum]AUX26900.1 B12-binding domain/radical SAM domain-containing protein [Sorangium cellulosum]